MKAKIKIEMRRQPVAQPRGIGILNPCQCGCSQPLFRRTDCGGFTLCCPECGTRIDQCVKTLTTENANNLRECWNNSILDAPLTQRFMDELGAENGSLLIVRDEDAVIMSIHNNDIDEALDFIKRECKRDFTIDYSICQFKQIEENDYVTCHIATSKILAYVGQFEGFDYYKMTTVDNE